MGHIQYFILVLLLFGMIFISGCAQISLDSNSRFFTPIKDLNQNPSTYVEQNINIKGKLNIRVGGYSIEDSEGYWVWIEDNCIEGQREYNYNSQTYTARGIWLSPKKDESGFGWGVEYKHRLSCISPLN